MDRITIKFNRPDRDYAVYLDGELVGFRASREEAEQLRLATFEALRRQG